MLQIDEFLAAARDRAVIDVRSPGEFADGHIVGAANVPLFDDDERAEIGTIYKRQGRDASVMRGLEISGPKFASIVRQVKKIVGKKIVGKSTDTNTCLVHCWRGGMRSESVGWLLNQAGVQNDLLQGGYKSYRHHVQSFLGRPYRLLVLSGMTGAAKTEFLHALRGRGEQVLDLEGLASHRGSAFGGIGLSPQPRVEHFENMMFDELSKLDPEQPIWVEDESRNIGRVYVPTGFFEQMREAPVLYLDVPVQRRAGHIADVYGSMPPEELQSAIERVTKRLGGLRTQQALDAVSRGDIPAAIEIMLEYYDKTYANSSSSRDPDLRTSLKVDVNADVDSILDRMIVARSQIMQIGAARS